MHIEFTLMLRITDETELREAAYQRAIEDGLSDEAAEEFRNGVMPVSQCVVMLLDPSTLEGASIEWSQADDVTATIV